MYPEAKIILNQRSDPESWGKSVEEALMFFNSWTYRITTSLSKADRLHSQMHFAAFEVSRVTYGFTSVEIIHVVGTPFVGSIFLSSNAAYGRTFGGK